MYLKVSLIKPIDRYKEQSTVKTTGVLAQPSHFIVFGYCYLDHLNIKIRGAQRVVIMIRGAQRVVILAELHFINSIFKLLFHRDYFTSSYCSSLKIVILILS